MKSFNELVYYYKENQNINAINEIYKNFHDKTVFYLLKIYKNNFYNLPLDKFDIENIIECLLLKSIKSYNYLQNNYNIEQHCLVSTKWSFFNEIQPYLRSSQRILNNYVSLSTIFDGNFLKDSSESLIFEENYFEIQEDKKYEIIKNETFKLLKIYNDFDKQEIIKLKLLGKSNQFVMQKFKNIDSRKISNMFYFFLKKLKINCLKVCYN